METFPLPLPVPGHAILDGFIRSVSYEVNSSLSFVLAYCFTRGAPIRRVLALAPDSPSRMAVSPFAARSPSVTVASPNTALKLKASTLQTASGPAVSAKAAYHTDRELTEQLNEEVRQKYVKGVLESASHGLQKLN